jgi:hypothetical protein
LHYDIGLGTAQAFGPHHEAAAIATLTAPTSGSTRIRRPSLSNGPKPEIGFSDAINNDIVILSNASSCLVYDRPIRRDGLLWSELIEWWRGVPGVEPDEPARTLGLRLRASLASDAELTITFRPLKSRSACCLDGPFQCASKASGLA